MRRLGTTLLVSDEERFRDLYDQYHRLVRNVLFNLAGTEALQDLTQEVFLKSWQALPRFAGRASLKTWLYRITINVAIDHLRRRRVRAVESASEDMDSYASADDAGVQTPGQRLVGTAVLALDEEHRVVVVLHYFEEMPLDEIARILALPVGTVKSRLHNARQKLGASLRARGVDL